jgi:hypothetical protein
MKVVIILRPSPCCFTIQQFEKLRVISNVKKYLWLEKWRKFRCLVLKSVKAEMQCRPLSYWEKTFTVEKTYLISLLQCSLHLKFIFQTVAS